MKSLLAIATLGAFALVAGCSHSDSAPPSSAKVNPCKLVTQEEVIAAMRRKSNPGEFHEAFNGTCCNFYDSTSQYAIFLQTVDPSSFEALSYGNHTTVNGIGDRAIWSDGSLYVQKGSAGMQIGFQLPHPLPAMTPPAETLARTIVRRM